VTFRNLGYGDFTINKIEAYAIDTTYGQGVPDYPIKRDAQGRLIPTNDYIITETQPNGAIDPRNAQVFPIAVPQGQTRTIYLSLIATSPGKRFAQVYIRTNGQNFSGRDTNGVLQEGVISFRMYGRGQAASLSDRVTGGLPKPVIFPITAIGDSSFMPITIANSGVCTLRVGMRPLELISGDVPADFAIVGRPTTSTDPVSGDLLIPPGKSDQQVRIRFTPHAAGSRRATLVLRTNDSTVIVPGHTERGSFYLDVFGSSPVVLSATNIDLGTALIGGTAADYTHGVIHLQNTMNTPLTITSITFVGTDSAEFQQDVTWPTLPKSLQPGETLDLGVMFAPVAGGSAGPRTGRVRLITSSNDTIYANVNGIAATRDIDVTPATLAFSARNTTGFSRQTVTIKNIGTMALHLMAPVLSGANASDFTIGMLPRLDLAPGQSEYLEVTYHKTSAGVSQATLKIVSDATSGAKLVTLGGTASRAGRGDGSTGTTGGNTPAVTGMIGLSGGTAAGVGSDQSEQGGVILLQSSPNPGRDAVEIGYRLAGRGTVTLAMYDGSGKQVMMVDAGVREAGDHSVQVSVAGLASGVYHYRLVMGDVVLDRTLTVVH